MTATLNDILYGVRVRLNEFKADKIGDTPLIDLANLAQEDLILELPDNALVKNTKKQGISSANGYDEYTLPSTLHKLLVMLQNDEGGPDPIVAALRSPALAGNVDNGTHSYKITCTIAAVESLASVSSNVVTVADKTTNGRVTLTLPLGPTGTTGRNVYRTEAGGAAYKLLTTIGDNTTLTYEDNTADSGLTTALPAQTKTSTPRVSQLISSSELMLVRNEPTAYQTAALERPRHWIDNAKFFVYPIPVVTRIGYFQLSFIAKPTRMTALANECAFDQEYTEALIWKTVIKALISQQKDPSTATAQYAATLQLTGVNLANAHRIS